MTDVVKILRAFRPGDVVFVECEAAYSAQTAERIKQQFNDILQGQDIRIVVLPVGMHVAAREETVDRSHLDSPSQQ